MLVLAELMCNSPVMRRLLSGLHGSLGKRTVIDQQDHDVSVAGLWCPVPQATTPWVVVCDMMAVMALTSLLRVPTALDVDQQEALDWVLAARWLQHHTPRRRAASLSRTYHRQITHN